MDDQIHSLAQELYQQKSLLVMGRGYNYATCLEGALVITVHVMLITVLSVKPDRTQLDSQHISNIITKTLHV